MCLEMPSPGWCGSLAAWAGATGAVGWTRSRTLDSRREEARQQGVDVRVGS